MSSLITKLAREKKLLKIDAKKPLILTVSEQDIRGAKAKSPGFCAFAVATKRQHPEIVNCYFYKTKAWLEYEDRLVRYHLPLAMQKEIASFDRFHQMKQANKAAPKGLAMQPGEYKALAVPKSNTTGYKKKENAKRYKKGEILAKAAAVVTNAKKKSLADLLKDIPSELRGKSLDEIRVIALSPPTPSARTEAINARSAKRPGRHQPGKGVIRRSPHKMEGVRTLHEPD